MSTVDWLALIRTPGLGATRLGLLIERFGSASKARQANRSELRGVGIPEPVIASLAHFDAARVEADQAWLDASGACLVGLDDPRYPPQLKEIPRPPAALFVLGDPDILHLPQIAIVGSRKATRGGLDNALDFSRTLAARGLVVTSGLALGVDGAAHRGALEAGGRTIAVVGTGLDTVYPTAHHDLAAEVAKEGCVVSEYPPGTAPKAAHFPARNRIISGLATGVLVVEAGVHSGSLITARMASEQNREVFAIPGSIHNPLARGCHFLIKQGAAKLTETADDLISEIGAAVRAQIDVGRRRLEDPDAESAAVPDSVDPDYVRLLECLDFDPISVDRLVERSGLTVDAVSSMLLIMELDGVVESSAGGRYCRRPESGSTPPR